MEDVGWLLFFIVVCVAASLFFSVNSLALRMFSRFKLQEAFKSLNKEELVDDLIDKSERILLSCRFFQLIFNSALFVLIFIFFETRQENPVRPAVYIWTFVCSIILFTVCSLAIPHAWAKYSGEKLLSRTYKLLGLFHLLAGPILVFFALYDDIIRRLSGVAEMTEEETQEEKHDELLSAVEQSKAEGVVDEEELEMIENVLDLTETTAGEIITPRTEVVALDVESDFKTVLDTIIQAGHSRIPVYEANVDKIIGLIYAKDLLSEVGKKSGEFCLREKIREAYFVPETKPLRDLLHEFQLKRQHIAIVLDEYGGTAGIVTIEDILEELVGEIVDEYEKLPPASIREVNETTIEMDSKIYIDDLNSDYDLNLPEDEDYDTVGGFVFSHLGYIPKTGEKFEYDHLRFVIALAEARKIKRIRIEKLPGFGKENQ